MGRHFVSSIASTVPCGTWTGGVSSLPYAKAYRFRRGCRLTSLVSSLPYAKAYG
ncbi:MAG: hypothetical protein LBD53_01610 [Tannerella sp.]|nr:hypothetical protein [Tannerella sp.]